MFYWNPTAETLIEFEPSTGWNSAFSEQDKLAYTNLYFFLKNKKGLEPKMAEIYTQMIIFKQKYNHLKYSDEQEELLSKVLKTVYS